MSVAFPLNHKAIDCTLSEFIKKMTIKFLKAGSGDCILIQHQSHNIIVDGGNDFVFLQDQVAEIAKNKEIIDLLIITHHDDDHINGVIRLLELANQGVYGEGFIKKVIFNSPRKILGTIPKDSDQSLSYRQAFQVEELLRRLGGCTWADATDKSPIEQFGNITLRFLSPVQEDLERYSEQPGAFLTEDHRSDWNSTMASLERYIDDANTDQSLANKTSIVILLEHADVKILLTGDCTPDRLEAILQCLIDEGSTDHVKLNYVKLPHHGSYRSLTKGVLEKIRCSRFIISTNGRRHFLPNKRALLKIWKYMPRDSGSIDVIFNYADALDSMKITPNEQKRYGLNLIANNEKYGFSI